MPKIVKLLTNKPIEKKTLLVIYENVTINSLINDSQCVLYIVYVADFFLCQTACVRVNWISVSARHS